MPADGLVRLVFTRARGAAREEVGAVRLGDEVERRRGRDTRRRRRT